MQGEKAEERARPIGPAAEGAVRRAVPAEVLIARVSAVTAASAAIRREGMGRGRIPLGSWSWGMRRGDCGCGCMHEPFAPRQPPVLGCALAITLCRGFGGRALGETERGKGGTDGGKAGRGRVNSGPR
ncbi:hypothetical protein Shyhy01_44060 [Streptomyces hygroscopicus subsp. hygroscopicus]|nr:hypothetical protein Shyhy01_44060 [Streptomyces hygroscopicus subsp. hygroscopicus]